MNYEYIVVSAVDIEQLITEVNSMLLNGWIIIPNGLEVVTNQYGTVIRYIRELVRPLVVEDVNVSIND